MSLANSGDDRRPGLAIISNVAAPYRIALHQRIAKEIPEFRLHTIFTHNVWDFDWKMEFPPEINVVNFHDGRTHASDVWQRGFWKSFVKGGEIAGYLKRHNVRAVILNGYSDAARLRLLRFCRRNGIAMFIRSDSNLKGDRRKSPLRIFLKRRLVGWVLKQCDGFMPMGRDGRDYYEAYGGERSRCFFVPAEPNLTAFESVDPDALAAFQARQNIDPARNYILFSGRLIQLKRIDTLIDAFAQVAERIPSWDLLIVGDGDKRAEWERRTPEALRHRVHWTGFLDISELTLAYHTSKILTLPSDREAWALVLPEAMAAGLPVISSDQVGAAREMIEDGKNGRIFAAGDVAQLAEAIADVTDPAKYAAYRAAVPVVFGRFREASDPVMGVRKALAFVGLI